MCARDSEGGERPVFRAKVNFLYQLIISGNNFFLPASVCVCVCLYVNLHVSTDGFLCKGSRPMGFSVPKGADSLNTYINVLIPCTLS